MDNSYCLHPNHTENQLEEYNAENTDITVNKVSNK